MTDKIRTVLGKQLSLGLALAVAGCSGGEAPPQAEEHGAEVTDDLYANNTKLWTDGYTETVIHVCFEESLPFTSERAWVKDSITKTWQAFGNVTFVGWDTCSGATTGLRVKFQDAGGSVPALGRDLAGVTNGVKLDTWVSGPSCVPGWTRERCVRSTAVHEFGHALGYAHEQNRPDTPAACKNSAQGDNGNQLLGGWDSSSVLNYCNPVWNNDGQLSETDKAGHRLLYGPFTVPCPPGTDSTCEDVTFNHGRDLNILTNASYPASSKYGMNGYVPAFSTMISVGYQFHNYWTVSFTAPKPIELPTDAPAYDFTRFDTNTTYGCIAFNTTTQQDSIAMRDLQHGGNCEPNSSLGYGAANHPRYLSTHYNRDPQYKNAETSWISYPKDNQPITITTKKSTGATAYPDLVQIKVKYGRIDIWSDTATQNGSIGATPTVANLGPGTHKLTIWSASKIVITAAGASPTSVSSNVPPAAIDGMIFGHP